MHEAGGLRSGAMPPSPAPTDPPELRGDADLQHVVLEDLDAAVNYRRWICRMALPFLGATPVEVGSGTGSHAHEWAEAGLQVTATEADHTSLARMQQRFADDPRVRVRHLAAPIRERADHSAAVAVNVLEHIEDDVAALRSFAGLVAPGGHVVILVPAFPIAFSDFDVRIGHVRRYRVGTLDAAFRRAGLVPTHMRYVNAPGLLAWLVLVRLLRGRPKEGLPLRVFERLVPWLARFEDRWHPPFGQSVFGVARVP